MTKTRFWWSVGAVWLVMFVTDWVFHGMWLKPWYEQTAQFWRPEAEMMSMMPAMWIGQAVFAWAFVWIYSNGISKDNQWWQAFRYAMAIILLAKVPQQLGMWATAPYPTDLVWRWFFVATFQSFAAAFVMTWTFKPMVWLKEAKSRA